MKFIYSKWERTVPGFRTKQPVKLMENTNRVINITGIYLVVQACHPYIHFSLTA